MKRIKLRHRILPAYTKGEEIFNMVSHIVGGGVGIAALALTVIRAALTRNVMGTVACSVYGAALVILYTMSSVYHGLRPPTAKKVFQILDHCTIYFLIAACYTPFALVAVRPTYPVIGWVMFGIEWALAALGVTLSAIDLHSFKIFSLICYICMGWGVLLVVPQLLTVLALPGFLLLLGGGVLYTVGSVFFVIGSRCRWFHSIFHLFVLFGSILHFFAIFFYVI